VATAFLVAGTTCHMVG